LEKPWLQLKSQREAAQFGVPFGGALQALLHTPQCSGWLATSTHWPSQFVAPGGQLVTQLPFAQTSFVPQAAPQPPQF
jgi:hypothetical protein